MKINLKEIPADKVNSQTGKYIRERLSNPGWLNLEMPRIRKKISDKTKEQFYSEMGILLSCGINIKSALELSIGEQKKNFERRIFQEISDRVVQGNSFSESLQESNRFSMYDYYNVKVGEESGRLPEILKELAQYYSKKNKLKRQVTGALTYPALVLFTAIVAVNFMLGFIVPLFKDVFQRFQGELPDLTRFIIRLSEGVKMNADKLVLILMLCGMALYLTRKKTWFRRIRSGLLLKIPVAGTLLRKFYLSRFCQVMALLIGSRIPMLKSIQLVSKMILFYPFESALRNIENDILHGKYLFQSMEHYSIFDSRIVSLTKVAEQVNQLDRIYGKLYEQYAEELEHQTRMLNNLLEPVMIIIVGVFVAIILISMYLPLFQISTTIL